MAHIRWQTSPATLQGPATQTEPLQVNAAPEAMASSVAHTVLVMYRLARRTYLSFCLLSLQQERQADQARRPGQLDYPTEIKRWRAFADQAEQMARRWEQRP